MWSKNNRFVEQLNTCVKKLGSQQQPSPKDIQNCLNLFENCMQSNIPSGQYVGIIECIIQVFVASRHLPSPEGIYRCFRKLIEWDVEQSKMKKAYYLINSINKICEKSLKNLPQKQLRVILTLAKNAADKHLASEIPIVLVDIYLEQLREIPKIQLSKSSIFHQLKHISAMFSILFPKYKPNLLQKLRKSVASNQFTSILILNQLNSVTVNQFWNSLLDAQTQRGIVIPNQYIKSQTLRLKCIDLVRQAFITCIKNDFFQVIPSISIFYPSLKCKLKSEQQFYSLMLLDYFRQKQSDRSLQRQQWIQITKMSWRQSFMAFWLNKNLTPEIKLKQWLKIATITCRQLCGNKYLPHQLFPIAKNIIETTNNINKNKEAVQELSLQYFQLYKQCIQMTQVKFEGISWQQFKQNQFGKVKQNNSGLDKELLYEQCLKIGDEWRMYLSKFSYLNMTLPIISEEDEILIGSFQKQTKVGNQKIKHWKIIISVMVQLLKQNYEMSLNIDDSVSFGEKQIPFSKLAQSGLQYFGIRNKSLQDIYSLYKEKQGETLIKEDSFSLECVRILAQIIKTFPLTEVTQHTKKTMSYYLDKVNDKYIKGLSNNHFFVKCMLLSNNSVKTKVLAEAFINRGKGLPEQVFKSQLAEIFNLKGPARQIAIEFTSYLCNREKYKFKMFLYQKKMTKYDKLIGENTANLIFTHLDESIEIIN